MGIWWASPTRLGAPPTSDAVLRMSYSDFTLAVVRQRLGLSVAEGGDLPANLADSLASCLPLALNLNTDKA